MKIVFMGTPEFARVPLVCLAKSKHQLIAVVTGPDKPAGRGRQLVPTPCKQAALEHDIPVLTPKSLKAEQLYADLTALKADLFVVVAFRILPERLFSLPKLGSINIHGSLLPKYRGAAPINWALINGESETGLTSFFLKKRVDTGDMITREKIPIDLMDSYDSLSEKMSQVAGPFLMKTLDMIESGLSEPIAQNESMATPARKLEPRDGLIDFDRPALAVHNQIRGMTSRPGAFSGFRGKMVKIKQTRPLDEQVTLPDQEFQPGAIIPHRKQLLVKCANQTLEILSLVPEGRKPMDGLSFINGFKPQAGEKFADQNL
jgi:methionyl-tRNA formyltransferase